MSQLSVQTRGKFPSTWGGGSVDAEQVTAIALAAGRGDPTASTAFVQATQADVWRLCAALADRDIAADLTQETYLRAFRTLPTFAARASARTWLLTIARRVCADHLRQRRRRPVVVTDLAGLDAVAAGQVPDASEHALVWSLVANLAPERREAFVLTQALGVSYAEAAEICGCPVGTIRSRIARARADLIAGLGDHGETGRRTRAG